MSYSSKLITLRTAILQLRALDKLLSDDSLTIQEYFSFTELLDQMLKIREKLDGKGLVLELTEDEEGLAVSYELFVRGQPMTPPAVLELDRSGTFSRRPDGSEPTVHPTEIRWDTLANRKVFI